MADPDAFFSDNMSYHILHAVLLLILSILAILAVALRFWARRIKKLSLELDDYLVMIGLVFTMYASYFPPSDIFQIFALAEIAMYIYGIPLTPYLQIREFRRNFLASFSPWVKSRKRLGYEAGPSFPKYDLLRLTERRKLSFISPVLWAIAVAHIRSSVVTLYIRIFRTQSFRLICYAVLILNVQFSIAAILAESLICLPIECRFNYIIPCRSCGDYAFPDLFAGIFNILLDIMMVILPMPMLWGLQMAVSKKLMLSGIFALGLA